MAFVFTAEDGTGLTAANSYATVDEFKDHHDGRGRDYAAYTDPQIQAALVKASDYIDKRFGRRWKGYRGSKNQGLDWPRIDAFDESDFLLSDVPDQLTKAAVEYAWLALTLGTELAPVPAKTAGRITKEKVGPIETAYGSDTQPMSSTGNLIQSIPEYPEADLWIEGLLQSSAARNVFRG